MSILQGPGGQQLPNTPAQLAAQQAQLASYLNATAPIRVKPSLHPQHSLPAQLMAAASGNLGLQDAALQLMGLQEALAAINLQQVRQTTQVPTTAANPAYLLTQEWPPVLVLHMLACMRGYGAVVDVLSLCVLVSVGHGPKPGQRREHAR